MVSVVWCSVHRVGWRLLCCRRTSFSSNVNLRETLSWYRPPWHKCSDTSCRCFGQLLLSQDNTSDSGGKKHISVSEHIKVHRSKTVAPVKHLDFAVVGDIPHPDPTQSYSVLLPALVLPLCFYVQPSCRSRDKWAQNGWGGLLMNTTSWMFSTFLLTHYHDSRRIAWLFWKTCWYVTCHWMN